MKERNIFFWLILFALIFSIKCADDSGNSSSDDRQPPETIDPFEMNTRIGRGVNLGNALEAPNEGDWGVTLQEAYFQLIKDAGFNSVRIPIRWSARAQATEPFLISTTFFKRVDWAVNQALSRGLVAIINIHHYEEIFENPTAHKQRLLMLWEQIAAHYQYYSANLLFEILNEPHNNLTSELWNEYLKEAITVVRKTNPTRNIIIGPANWNGIYGLSSLTLPETDRQIIVTVHYYNPFEFTHQGAEWVDGSDAWLGRTWQATTSEKQAMINDLDLVANWATTQNRPIYIGEFGAYSKADMTSRATWTTFITRQAEKRNMSWAYWEFCSGFGVYDATKNEWIGEILRALIP